MNGRHFLLDTNAIIQLLAGNGPLRRLLEDAEFLCTSVICQLEFLSYPGLTDADRALLSEFLGKICVLDVASGDEALMSAISSMRVGHGLKLPDAIIAGTASVCGCEIVTADDHFSRQDLVPVVGYEVL